MGKRYPYALKLTTTVAFGEGANAFDFDVDGRVVVVPTSSTQESTTLFMVIAEPKIVSRVPGSQPDFDKIAAQLAKAGCFISLSGGRTSAMQIPTGLSAMAVTLYREIAARLQFAHPVKSAERYQADEYDATGQYSANYEQAGDPGIWHKRKLRYQTILLMKGAEANVPTGMIPRILSSEGEFRLSPEGRPSTVRVADEVLVSGAQSPIHSRTTVALEGSPPEPQLEHPDWAALSAKMETLPAAEPYGGQAAIEALDDARIRGLTFTSIVTRLEQLVNAARAAPAGGADVDAGPAKAQQQNIEEQSQLFTALAATFRRKPETVALAVQRIAAGSPAADVLVDALGSSGAEPAHKALAELLTAKTTAPGLRNRVTVALVRTSKPSGTSIQALEAMLGKDPFSMDALYGLGTYSRKLRDGGNAEQSRAIGELLIERLARAGDVVPHINAVLGGITNAGYDPALPRVAPFLEDRREEVRAAAVRALQSMRDPKADELIVQRLKSDHSSDVVISAIDALRVRAPSDLLAGSVAATAAHAADPAVRYRAVDLLIEWKPRRPDLQATLSEIATNDAEERIRARAKAAL